MAEPLGRNLGPGSIYKVSLPKPGKSTIKSSKLPAVKRPTLVAGSFHNAPKQGAGSSSNTPSIFGSSQLGLGGSINPFAGISFPKPLTATQQAAKNYADAHAGDHSHGGFMGLIHDAGDALGWTLDKIQRPWQAVANAALAETHHNHNSMVSFDLFDPGAYAAFGHGFMQGLEGKKQTSFAQVMEQNHVLDGHSWVRDAAGLGLDIASDPLNLVGGSSVVARAGTKGFDVFRGLQKIDKASESRYIAELADMNGGKAGKKWLDHMEAVKAKDLKSINAPAPEITAQMEADHRMGTFLETQANELARANTARYLGIKLGPATIRTPLKIGKTLAEKEAGLAAGKLGMRFKAGLANSFKPAYMNPVGHALELFDRHTSEDITHVTWDAAKRALKPYLKGQNHMAEKDMQRALIAASETAGTVKDGKIVTSVLQDALKAHGITGDAATKAEQFVRAYHAIGHHLRELDRVHGVEYTKGAIDDRVYVPHIFEKGKSTERVMFSKSTLSKAGYAEHGQNIPYSVQLKLAEQEGGRHIITDPIELLGHRVAKGAEAASHGIIRQGIRDTVARREREFDITLRPKAFAKANKLRASKAALEAQIAGHGGKQIYHRLMAGQTRAKFQRSLDHEVAQNEQKIAGLTKKLKTAKGKSRGSLTASLNAAKRDQARLQAVVAEAPHETAYREAVNQQGIEGARTLTEAKANLDKIGKLITAEEPKAVAAMWRKNPEALEQGWRRVESLSHMGEDGKIMHYTVPVEVHDGIANIEKAMIDPSRMASLEKSFSKAISIWKLSVTSVNPGYRIRNSISDLWNMYIRGVPATAIPVYAAKAMHTSFLARKGERKIGRLADISEQESKLGRPLTLDEFRSQWAVHNPYRPDQAAETEKAMRKEYQRYRNVGAKTALTLTPAERDAMLIIRKAHSQGVMSGQFEGDVAKGINRMRTGNKNPITGYARKATTFNAEAENVGRLTHYLYRLDHGHSEFSAAQIVKGAHFDYEDLSKHEQHVLKNIAPFYTWTRKNVPYQLQAIATHPGRVATYGKVANTSEQVSGAKPSDIIGHALDYHPLGFRLGGGFIDPQIGLNDLYNIEHPANELNMVNPAFQDAITALTGRQFQTGQALQGPEAAHQAVPAPGWLSNILQPFGLGERTQRMVNGVEQPGPGVNPWVAQIAGQIPLGSYLMSRNPIDEARKGTTGLPSIPGPISFSDPRTLSYLGGLSYTNVDPKNQLAIASMEQAAAQKAYIKHLRDEGLMAPSDWTPGHSWFDKYLAKMNKKHTQRG